MKSIAFDEKSVAVHTKSNGITEHPEDISRKSVAFDTKSTAFDTKSNGKYRRSTRDQQEINNSRYEIGKFQKIARKSIGSRLRINSIRRELKRKLQKTDQKSIGSR